MKRWWCAYWCWRGGFVVGGGGGRGLSVERRERCVCASFDGCCASSGGPELFLLRAAVVVPQTSTAYPRPPPPPGSSMSSALALFILRCPRRWLFFSGRERADFFDVLGVGFVLFRVLTLRAHRCSWRWLRSFPGADFASSGSSMFLALALSFGRRCSRWVGVVETLLCWGSVVLLRVGAG